MARVTERVRLGPAALNATTLHPVEIAGQTAALDLASSGRAYAGIVTGSWLDQLGIDEDRPLTRLREAVEVVRRLLAGDTSGFAGEQFTLAPGAGLAYEPLRRQVPLLIGTWRPRAAAFAATVADEVKIGGCANPDMVRLMREWLGAGRAAHRRRRRHRRRRGRRRRAPPGSRRRFACTSTWSAGWTRRSSSQPATPVPLEKFVLAGTPDEVGEAGDRADRRRGLPRRVRHPARADDGGRALRSFATGCCLRCGTAAERPIRSIAR